MTKPSKKDKLFFLDKLEEMFEHLPSYLQPKILNAVAFLFKFEFNFLLANIYIYVC